MNCNLNLYSLQGQAGVTSSLSVIFRGMMFLVFNMSYLRSLCHTGPKLGSNLVMSLAMSGLLHLVQDICVPKQYVLSFHVRSKLVMFMMVLHYLWSYVSRLMFFNGHLQVWNYKSWRVCQSLVVLLCALFSFLFRSFRHRRARKLADGLRCVRKWHLGLDVFFFDSG